jgi:hypothetical protein
MRRIAAAVAAIALMTGVAHAQGHGQGNGGGGGKPAAADKHGGGNVGGQGNADRGNRGQGGGPSMAQSMRGSDNRGSENRGGANAQSAERGNKAKADRNNGNNDRQVERAVERANNDNRANGNRGNDSRAVVIDRRGGDRGIDFARVRDSRSIEWRGLIDGCPPGLAKKHNGCQPPGQARKDDWLRWDRPDFWGLSRLGAGRYFYDDGYLMRYGPDGRIGGYVPLLGGALSIGNAWPSYYEPVALPSYYERYYGLGGYDSYRYADDVIYRVDPRTDAITSIAALLTGDNFGVGQPMPLGYDVYNVPYGYRDRYVDGPDSYYRYADGYVYEADPQTRLITSVIELLAS